jgi:hypothetical protein
VVHTQAPTHTQTHTLKNRIHAGSVASVEELLLSKQFKAQ